MKSERVTRAASVLAAIALCVAILALSGCAMLDPGGQVARGLGQSKIYEWREDGGFWVEGRGAQTEAFTMVEGQIVMREDGEGRLVPDLECSVITHYLRADPSADAAQSAMVHAFKASTEQAKAWNRTVERLVSLIAPMVGRSIAAPATQPAPPP